ncbi:MAG: SpoIIE family protein phosphatase [Azospirillum sp.]|nr:SpoIIE family protein phosphatase [Azospirillum sp.]
MPEGAGIGRPPQTTEAAVRANAAAVKTVDLVAGHRRILLLTFLGIILVANIIVFVQQRQEYLSLSAVLENHFLEKVRDLDRQWKGYAQVVDALRTRSEIFWNRTREPDGDPLQRWLFRNGADGPVDLDTLPDQYRTSEVGNLTGVIEKPDPQLLIELEMAIQLNDWCAGFVSNLPEIAWCYYLSDRHFINLFPWVPSSRYRYGSGSDDKSALLAALPSVLRNGSGEGPYEQSRQWSDVYPDPAGAGPIITVSQPVYLGGRFRGIAAVDLSPAELRKRLQSWFIEAGEVFVVNDSQQVLARSSSATELPTARSFRDVLPDPLKDRASELLSRADPDATPVKDYEVQAIQASDAPVTFVYIIPKWDIYFILLKGDLGFLLALIFSSMLMLVVATIATNHQLVRPSQQLLEFISRESRNEGGNLPMVAPNWQPCFESIRLAFAAHTGMVALQQELEVARQIQRTVLPTHFPARPEVRLSCRMVPARDVAGDLYDFFWLDQHRLAILIGDVVGKGVPAALFMMMVHTFLRAKARQFPRPGSCLRRVNARLVEDNDAVNFVTAVYGVLDVATGVFTYANAGHLPMYLLLPDGAVSVVHDVGGTPLGMVDGASYAESRMTLPAGASLLLYTDGITEAFDPAGEQFGEARLCAALAESHALGPDAILDEVFSAVGKFKAGAPQGDDWTCLLVQYTGERGDQG